MLYSEIIAVCSEIHTKHINMLCGQNAEFVNIKPGGTYSDHWDLKGLFTLNMAGVICFVSCVLFHFFYLSVLSPFLLSLATALQ